jgi:hypothetical protein
MTHLTQIKQSLGIAGVLTETSSWRSSGEDGGAQIDLVIDRADNVINLCEVKFASDEFVIDKPYSEVLRRRGSVFANQTKTRKGIVTTMITTFGLKRNMYQGEIVSEITLDDLFG